MDSKLYKLLIAVFFFMAVLGCEKKWEDHYDVFPETVNKPILEELQKDSRVSSFVELLEQNKTLDTLTKSKIPFTLIIPSNEVLDSYLQNEDLTENYLGYHVVSEFIQSGNIRGSRVVQTLTEKYINFERYGETFLVDGVEVSFESPLYLDGKYFILEDVIEPLPNLYEYFKVSNPILSDYIDTQDSLALDKELSVPIGFDENGNTVYDTVANIINLFEEKYFPVKHEFRENSATIVFPKSEDYNLALNNMADRLGDAAQDYNDIPIGWQYDVLMPFLFKQGIFLNRIEPEEFMWDSETDTTKLLNILGDSATILYTPTDKFVASNGYAYNYSNFTIPDSLFLGELRFEAEKLLIETGINRYAWSDSVTVVSDIAVQPQMTYLASASNDTLLRVDLPKGYTGNYSFEFEGPNLFPRRYLMVIEAHMDYGGIYDIYINDELVKTFDYSEFQRFRGVITSVTGQRYFPRGRYNKFDFYVDNITSYERVRIRFEYKGPSTVLNNGLIIDYIEFQPM